MDTLSYFLGTVRAAVNLGGLLHGIGHPNAEVELDRQLEELLDRRSSLEDLILHLHRLRSMARLERRSD